MNKKQVITKITDRLANLSRDELDILKSAIDALDLLQQSSHNLTNNTGEGSTDSAESYLSSLFRKDDKDREEKLEKLTDDDETELDLTARGTPRIRHRYRSREEIGGDSRAEQHRANVRIGGRVRRELAERFVACAQTQGKGQGAALTEALEDFLAKYDPR